MRFLVDHCAGRRLAEWLDAQGHDVVDAGALESDRQALESQALVTIRGGRIRITHPRLS